MGKRRQKKNKDRKEKKKPSNHELAMKKIEQGALRGLLRSVQIHRDNTYPMRRDDWAYVTSDGNVYLNSSRDASPNEWVYIIAHCLLHLGMDHIREDRAGDHIWQTACDLVVARFLEGNRIGTPPADMGRPIPVSVKTEEDTFEKLRLAESDEYSQCLGFGTMSGRPDMVWNGPRHKERWERTIPVPYPQVFAASLQEAMEESLWKASVGLDPTRTDELHPSWYKPGTIWRKARDWFLSSYPLLGAVACAFKLVDDRDTVTRMGIPVAAISSELQEIYINPITELELSEWKFVLAHEFMHAALRHDMRCGERNPVLWNVACDFVINGWLVDMNVGTMPEGSLYDQQLEGLSAEEVYDVIWKDMKRYTGQGAPRDIIYGKGERSGPLGGCDLDDFYRSALARGLSYHEDQGRGYLPAGLVEEIYAMSRPPIKWDVQLAKWFDEYFSPQEKHRTYARLSRRQSSTPDIPRAAWHRPEQLAAQQTYAVVLDTSGSMDRHMLAAALGSIASYSVSRDVDSVRVLFCDAAVYDQGMMRPEDIAGQVKIRGRGGTVLQPAIDLLNKDESFPRDAPLLIITDGWCDRLSVPGRDHAYLVPRGARLPFVPKGPVFRMDP